MEVKTAHINANTEDFAKTVLMPGDPLRSKFIAENFLTDAKLINNVRGIQGYTGFYKGHKVTVMASGMGCPSMGIYSYELFKYCNVENIIRIGSAGALDKNIKLNTILIGEKSISNSNYNNELENNNKEYILDANEQLITNAELISKELNLNTIKGMLYCSDTFYDENNNNSKFASKGAKAVEMESMALYINAKKLNKKALAIVTISDNIITKEQLSAEDRQNSFTNMMKLALELAVRND